MKKIVSIWLCVIVMYFSINSVFAQTVSYQLQKEMQYKLCKKNEQQLEISNNNYKSGFYPTEKGLKNGECKRLMKEINKYSEQKSKSYRINVIWKNLLLTGFYCYVFRGSGFEYGIMAVGFYKLTDIIFFYDREEIERKLGEVSKKAIEYGCFEYEEK